MYSGCANLERITIPASLTDITSFPPMFFCRNCPNLKEIIFKSNAISLPSMQNTGILEFTFPPTVGLIANSLFEGCTELHKVNFNNVQITELPQYIFRDCSSLRTVNLPQTITTFGNSTFAGSSIQSITIPSGVTNLGSYTFQNCIYLKEIHMLPTTPPTISAGNNTYANPFKNTHPNLIIYVPVGCLSAYTSATNWSSFASIIQEEST